MNAGTIVADGDPQKVMADRTVIDAYLGGALNEPPFDPRPGYPPWIAASRSRCHIPR